MTKCRKTKVWHESNVFTYRRRALLVAESPDGVWIREKGTRTALMLPWGLAWQYAAEAHVESVHRARLAAKGRVPRKIDIKRGRLAGMNRHQIGGAR